MEKDIKDVKQPNVMNFCQNEVLVPGMTSPSSQAICEVKTASIKVFVRPRTFNI